MSALPKIEPCPKCGERDHMSIYTYDSGATYVECTMDCGYRGPACTTARWAVRHHNEERDDRARSYIQAREAALAETRDRLEKVEAARKAVQKLGALLSSKPHRFGAVEFDRYFEWAQKLEKAHADIRDALDRAALTGDAPEAGR